MILAGDIGGTSSRLAIFEKGNGRLKLVAEQTYPSQQFKALEDIAHAFATTQKVPIQGACFGIAGPVRNGRVTTPNLAWVVDADGLARALSTTVVKLINDLEANAYGIAALEPGDLVTLNAGARDAKGNAAVISVGTGLGEAGLYWDGKGHHPFACEGGHADFAPRNELQSELMLYLRDRLEHVSYERVLSGPGLHNIYQFLRDTGRGKEPAWLAAELHGGDPSASISRAALENRSDLCVQALDIFVDCYGAEAGNLALKTMATGGMYIGGGIAPKILRRLQAPSFMAAFTAKGRMQPLMESIPVKVILKESTALLGAGLVAAQLVA
jgi:glucokinase